MTNATASDEIIQKIIKQVEFYFGDHNLPKDKFLSSEVSKNDGGYVRISTIASFARMKALSTDIEVIKTALRTAAAKENALLGISDDGECVKRIRLMPESLDTFKSSLYCKGFPLDATLDSIETFLNSVCAPKAIRLRRRTDFITKENVFAGSVFIEFDSENEANRVAALSLSYPVTKENSEVEQLPLTLMTKEAYFLGKSKKYNTTNPVNSENGQKQAEEEEKDEKDCLEDNFKPGHFIKLSGFPLSAATMNMRHIKTFIGCIIDGLPTIESCDKPQKPIRSCFIDFDYFSKEQDVENGRCSALVRLVAPVANAIYDRSLEVPLEFDGTKLSADLLPESTEKDLFAENAKRVKAPPKRFAKKMRR